LYRKNREFTIGFSVDTQLVGRGFLLNTRYGENTTMENENKISLVWGNAYLDEGFTPMPNIIVRYAPKLLSGREFTFITVLASFKHGVENPFPSQDTLAEIMGCSKRNIRLLIETLEEKGFLQISYRYDNKGRTSNEYNFKPLLEICLKEAMQAKMQSDIENGVRKVAKTKSSGRKPSSTSSGSKTPRVAEENLPHPAEENLPQVVEENLPMNKQSNKQINKKINKQVTMQLVNEILNKYNLNYDKDCLHALYKTFYDFQDNLTQYDFRDLIIELSKQNKIHNNYDKGLIAFLRGCVKRKLNPVEMPKKEKKFIKSDSDYLPSWFNESEEEKKQKNEKKVGLTAEEKEEYIKLMQQAGITIKM
jgi:predicted transcriptional regulator